MFTDFHDDSVERRHQEELDAMPNRGEMLPLDGSMRCFKCGHGIELSKHYGSVWTFDRGTETLHVCKPRYNELMAAVRKQVWREARRD